MPKLFQWVRSVSDRVFDPKKEERIAYLAKEVEQQLFRDRNRFNLDQTLTSLGVEPEDAQAIAERVFRLSLERVWLDLVATENERKALDFVGRSLGLKGPEQQRLERTLGLEKFGDCLRDSVKCRTFEEHDRAKLTKVAGIAGESTRSLISRLFAREADQILRSIFWQALSSGTLDEAIWNYFIQTIEFFGRGASGVYKGYDADCEQVVNGVLAHAWADQEISAEEGQKLRDLLSILGVSDGCREQVLAQLAQLEEMTQINAGQLPSIACSSLSLRAGEILHFQGQAVWGQIRQLRSGPQILEHAGVLTITDCRTIFESPVKTHFINHQQVAALIPTHAGFEIRTNGKGAGQYRLGDIARGYAVYRVAVRKANQTIVDQAELQSARHIPRDVRQRVFQRCGGQCVECGARDYLEFDHVIPVARGGSNSDNNIQLLCRRCNSKKSDFI